MKPKRQSTQKFIPCRHGNVPVTSARLHNECALCQVERDVNGMLAKLFAKPAAPRAK